MSAHLDVPTFVARWQRSTLTERSAAQQHFLDLCAVLGEPTPAATDPDGTHYTFEKGARKTSGAGGWADVWKRRHFAWEYKGKHKDLTAAYRQIQQYREDLENPPLLVVCDLDRFEVHTNFTNTVKAVYAFDLADLAHNEPTPTCALPPLEVLRAAFTHPDLLRPNRTTASVTEDAAREFAALAESLRRRGEDPEATAHFLMRLLFCLFAEDIDLLPAGLFTRLVAASVASPGDFGLRLRELFARMATGGFFGEHKIPYFNGGLFADDTTLALAAGDVAILARAAALDWASIEPAIFGTLFERSLDPTKRSQLGAHYTSRDDIVLIIEPVLMAPLRRRWAAVQEEARILIGRRDAASDRGTRTRHQQALARLLLAFTDEIAAMRILDPACGSGNFLYVALKRLLDLWKEVSAFAATSGVAGLLPDAVGPQQLYGIEVNVYAHELASVVVWIGYIQWLHDNGFGIPDTPILKPLHNIQRLDALLARDETGCPVEPAWPEADVIVGNPPFLGGNKIRQELGSAYVDDLFRLYQGRVPAFSDLVCYWFERARALITTGKVKRVGLLATNSIRGGANRRVLERIKETGDIFWAESDRPWVLNGANVRVSMVGFDAGAEVAHQLDDQPVASINPDLTTTAALTTARRLTENGGICFMGPSPKAPFDIPAAVARTMLGAPVNVNGRPNSDVVRPVASAVDLVGRPRGEWTIDFGQMSLEQAALYEMPFAYVKEHVHPVRMEERKAQYAGNWWQYARPRVEMRAALQGKARYIATPGVSKHRIFVWVAPVVLCNQGTLVVARDDDYFFGVLQSTLHELWALRMGTALEDRPRYTPTSTFETFPFPWPPRREPAGDLRMDAIAVAARALVEQRDRWLNPEGATEADLRARTLTALYNARPTWLDLEHRRLDDAVLDAYGWPRDLGDEEILSRLLALNLERAGTLDPCMVPGVVRL
jgi:hypothetical protein